MSVQLEPLEAVYLFALGLLLLVTIFFSAQKMGLKIQLSTLAPRVDEDDMAPQLRSEIRAKLVAAQRRQNLFGLLCILAILIPIIWMSFADALYQHVD